MSKRAVVVIDLQNEYFPSGKLPLVGIEEAVANAARVIAAARSNGDPVIHVRHESIAPDAPFFVHGTKGVRIHSAVAPIEGEAVVLKNYPNAFLKTDLKQMLDANGVENVVVIGAMSHMCIDATCRAASDLGYKTIVVHDACATRDLEFGGQVVPAAQVHAAMMAALAFAYAKITTTDEYFAR
ncbi:MAG: cysteine hydrolase family protein [Pseudomonadota bacterium]